MDVNYIPKTLDESHQFLDEFLQDKDVFKNFPEDILIYSCQLTLGSWLRVHWYLLWNEEDRDNAKEINPDYPKEKPELVKWFNDLGVIHSEYMSTIIITSYHKKLNDKHYNLEEDLKTINEIKENI
jgi:hypothetical protein